MIDPENRKMAFTLIDEAVASGARLIQACKEIGISRRTYDRWCKQRCEEQSLLDRRGLNTNPKVAQERRLLPEEEQAILDTCNSAEFANLPPSQIAPALADRGDYIASESTMYRVLRKHRQLQRRGRAKAHTRPAKPDEIKATDVGQCYCWDITWLPTLVTGMFFKLYMVLDLYSRKVVGWEVHETELGQHAKALFDKIHLRERPNFKGLSVHSDNGAPMKGMTLQAMFANLGISSSFSRPSVSNDNPFAESLFRTLKYVPMFPEKPFETIEQAREWVHRFVKWYNTEHKHSALNFVTPEQKHRGEDHLILASRHTVYEAAKARNPSRWSGKTRNWAPVVETVLNPVEQDQSCCEAA